ncbi:MAG TPA: hypothetical protein VMS99_08480 [Acidimicrobiia bacterium]|nr:hypothetical protein [Acidimicrobiia bacterium]
MTRPTSTSPGRVAVAVTREDPPRLIVATDDDVLSRAIATKVIAQEDPGTFEEAELKAIRSALLEERWSDAVAMWIETTAASVDVYPDEEILRQEDLTTEAAAFSIRLSRLFADENHQE